MARCNEHRVGSFLLSTRLHKVGKTVLFHGATVHPLIVNVAGALQGHAPVGPKVGKVACILVRRLLQREILALQKLISLAEIVLVVHIGGSRSYQNNYNSSTLMHIYCPNLVNPIEPY